MCVVVAAITGSVIVIGGDETIARLESTPTEFSARTVGPPRVLRPQIWQATVKLIQDYPLLGIGFGAYPAAIPRYLSSSGDWTPQQAHNDYLEVLASGGALGVALCAWFVVSLVRSTREQFWTHSLVPRALRCGALAGLFAVAIHSFFDFGLHITVNALVCTVLVVIAVKNVGLVRPAVVAAA